MLTIQTVKDHLGIDYEDEMVTRTLERLMKVADSELVGSLGKNYPKEDPRAEELALMIIEDLYSNRGITDKVSGNIRRMLIDFSTQLRVEMRGSGENAVR